MLSLQIVSVNILFLQSRIDLQHREYSLGTNLRSLQTDLAGKYILCFESLKHLFINVHWSSISSWTGSRSEKEKLPPSSLELQIWRLDLELCEEMSWLKQTLSTLWLTWLTLPGLTVHAYHRAIGSPVVLEVRSLRLGASQGAAGVRVVHTDPGGGQDVGAVVELVLHTNDIGVASNDSLCGWGERRENARWENNQITICCDCYTRHPLIFEGKI